MDILYSILYLFANPLKFTPEIYSVLYIIIINNLGPFLIESLTLYGENLANHLNSATFSAQSFVTSVVDQKCHQSVNAC